MVLNQKPCCRNLIHPNVRVPRLPETAAMALEVRRIYFTDNLFIKDVLHLNIPYPEVWKVLILYILLFFLPLTFSKSPFDRRIAHTIDLLFDVISSIISPKRFLRTFCKLIRSFNKASLIAFLVFATKSYVTNIGVRIEREGIAFNQPVIYRAEVKPWEGHCKLMNTTTERQYLMWEVQYCSKTKRTHGYHKTFYVPSVMTVDGSEQRCLPQHKSSAIGRVEFCEAPPAEKTFSRSYEHSVSKIRDDCKRVGTNCDFIKRAVSRESSTYIEFSEEWRSSEAKRMSEAQSWLRVEHFTRPFVPLYVMRELALAADVNSSSITGRTEAGRFYRPIENFVRAAFAVNQAVEYSRCFEKSNFVETIKVSNLVIHLMPLTFLFILEHMCRRYLERLMDTTPEDAEGYDEHLNVIMNEALSS